MKDKVSNFFKQKTRIGKYNDTSNNKAGKKGIFGPILNRIREAGGGNSSNLKCNGNNSSPGAKQLKNLTESLFKCEENINKSCNADIAPLREVREADPKKKDEDKTKGKKNKKMKKNKKTNKTKRKKSGKKAKGRKAGKKTRKNKKSAKKGKKNKRAKKGRKSKKAKKGKKSRKNKKSKKGKKSKKN